MPSSLHAEAGRKGPKTWPKPRSSLARNQRRMLPFTLPSSIFEPYWPPHLNATGQFRKTMMGIVKLLTILGPEASILHTGTGEQQTAQELAALLQTQPTRETTFDYTISNGYIYRVDGQDSLARKPFGQVLACGPIDPEHLAELDAGGQLWRELKRLSGGQ